jgi:hypothetical protein
MYFRVVNEPTYAGVGQERKKERKKGEQMSDTPKKGAVFQNIDDCKEYVFNGTEWVERMSDTPTPTPRTDAAAAKTHGMPEGGPWLYVTSNFARQLERELAAVTKELAVSNADKNLFKASCDLANVLLNESVAREKIAIKSTWIPASTKPEGYERRVLLWTVYTDFGWRDQPEAKIGWWKHGPGCFAFDGIENADHLVTHWMEIADPTQAKEAR